MLGNVKVKYARINTNLNLNTHLNSLNIDENYLKWTVKNTFNMKHEQTEQEKLMQTNQYYATMKAKWLLRSAWIYKYIFANIITLAIVSNTL